MWSSIWAFGRSLLSRAPENLRLKAESGRGPGFESWLLLPKLDSLGEES